MRANCEICHLLNVGEEARQQQILFHKFPTTRPDICKKWLEVVGKEKLWHLAPSKLVWRFVCSRHFSHSSYPGPCSRVLYHDAVPDRSLKEHESGPRPPGFVRKKNIIPISISQLLEKYTTNNATSISDTTVAISTSTTSADNTTFTPATSAAIDNSTTTTTTETTLTPAASPVTCATSTTTTVTNSMPATSAVTTTSTTTTITTTSPAAGIPHPTQGTLKVVNELGTVKKDAPSIFAKEPVPPPANLNKCEVWENNADEIFAEDDDNDSHEQGKVTCRLCACNVINEDVTAIFPPVYSSDGSLLDKINSLLPEKVRLDDGLPTHVCKTCVAKVENCVYTIKRFVYADKKLRRMLENSQSAMHDHLTLALPHPLKVKRLEEARKNKGKRHKLIIVSTEPLKLIDANRPKSKKTAKKLKSTQKSSSTARKSLTLKTSYKSTTVYYRIVPAKATGSKTTAHSPEATASEDAPDISPDEEGALVISPGEEGAPVISPGEEGDGENTTGKHVFEECDVESVLFNIYPCSFCDKAFPTRKQRRIHETSGHVGETPISGPKMRFQCYACKKRFLFGKHLKDHIREVHLPPEYKCEICRAIFISKRHALIHSRKHSGVKLYPCKFCDQSFGFIKELLLHRRVHIVKRSKSLSCQVCGKSFENRASTNAHERSHERTLCHLCGKSLPPALLKVHLDGHDKILKCSVCGKTFNDGLSFRMHKYRAHKPSKHLARTFHCSVCDRGFKLKDHLLRHMLVHSSLKNFKCDICPSTFKHHRNLISHKKRHKLDSSVNSIAVAGTGPYTCLLCGKQFQSMAGYHTHNITQHASRLRPFECPTCNKKYSSPQDLKKHIQRHILSQQPSSFYTCIRCGMFFKRKQTLDRHICRYRNDKPYKCSVCGRTFFRRQFLFRHMENFHNHEKPVDLSTTATAPEDAGTENSPPNCETDPLGQTGNEFQDAYIANIDSEGVCIFNYKL